MIALSSLVSLVVPVLALSAPVDLKPGVYVNEGRGCGARVMRTANGITLEWENAYYGNDFLQVAPDLRKIEPGTQFRGYGFKRACRITQALGGFVEFDCGTVRGTDYHGKRAKLHYYGNLSYDSRNELVAFSYTSDYIEFFTASTHHGNSCFGMRRLYEFEFAGGAARTGAMTDEQTDALARADAKRRAAAVCPRGAVEEAGAYQCRHFYHPLPNSPKVDRACKALFRCVE